MRLLVIKALAGCWILPNRFRLINMIYLDNVKAVKRPEIDRWENAYLKLPRLFRQELMAIKVIRILKMD